MDVLALLKWVIEKPLDMVLTRRAQYHQEHATEQENYLDDAMGSVYCLHPEAMEPEAVSLDSLVRRAHLRQREHPEPSFPAGRAEIEVIAERMVHKGKLNRGRYPSTYKRK